MSPRRLLPCLALLVGLSTVEVHADEPPPSRHTLTLAPGAERPKAKIEDVAWIAGHWMGPGLGGLSEEIWSPPLAGSMMGSYRFLKNDKVVFYEICTIVEDAGSLTVRLKHFHSDLTGWEEKGQVVSFPLVKLGEREAFFDGMTFRKLDNGDMDVYVSIRKKDGTIVGERFAYRPRDRWLRDRQPAKVR